MSRKAFLYLILIAIFFAYFCSILATTKTVNYNNKSQIYAFGDSLTVGYGSHKSYSQYLQDILKVKVHNLGVNGELTSQGLKRLKKIFSSTPADIVILIHGGNDFLQNKPINQTYQNLEKMIQFLLQKKITPILLRVPQSLFGLLFETNKVYTKLAQKYDLVYDGEIISKLLTQPQSKSDKVHLNSNGYKELAKKIALLFEKEN